VRQHDMPVKSALLVTPFRCGVEMARAETAAGSGNPPDAERIDYLFWNHDRHAGNRTAMQAYLRWETELPEQIAADGLAGFTLNPH
jgi:hypothetical protein